MSTASSTSARVDRREDIARASAARARASFFRARLASALGIFPLGVWTVLHLWNNLSAFQGKDAWESAVTEYPHPFAQALAGILVLLPPRVAPTTCATAFTPTSSTCSSA